MTLALHISRHAPLMRTSLTERATALRAALARVSRTPVAPHGVRANLLAAYAEFNAARPFYDEVEDLDPSDRRAAARVDWRLRNLLSAIIKAPTPTSPDGLGTLALAMAIDAEGKLNGCCGDSDAEYARAARALVILTGVALPSGFTGFGDEPDHEAREADLLVRPGRLPAWARVEVADPLPA